MALDYFTLRSVALELSQNMVGRKIDRVEVGPGFLALASGAKGHLQLLLGRGGWALWRRRPLGQKAPAKGAEPYLIGARVEKVEAAARDRIIRLRLERKNRQGVVSYGLLVLELFPPQARAVLVSERTGAILGVWSGGKGGRMLEVDAPYQMPPSSDRLVPGEDEFIAFKQRLQGQDLAFERALAKVLVGADKDLGAEMLYRAQVDPLSLPTEVPVVDLERLWQVLVESYQAPTNIAGYWWKEPGGLVCSGLEPTRLADYTAAETISLALLEVERQRAKEQKKNDQRRDLFRRLKQGVGQLKRTLAATQKDLDMAADAEVMERLGSIIMAQLEAVEAGRAEADLIDIYEPSNQQRVIVPLDRRLSPAENGSAYLRKAQKYKRRLKVLPKRIATMERNRMAGTALLEGLKAGQNPDLEPIHQWLEEQGLSKRNQTKNAKEERAHPRRYRTSNGWSVWAGRNNRENDVLTHRLAAQNDLWFHAHGYPGSHVVLRREGRKEDPSARTIEEAASVAAYWSKGKTANKVPVVYTLAKYVSKPRGGAPGQALMRREKTIMVSPALLAEED